MHKVLQEQLWINVYLSLTVTIV